MKKEKIIEIEKGDIIAVLTCGYPKKFFAHTLVRDLNSKNVLVFCRGVEKFSYYPCKMAMMDYGYDLIEMTKDFAKDYTIGIINSLKVKFNTKETIEFIKTLKQDNKLKNKTFVLIFSLGYDEIKRGKRIILDDFEDYKETIEKYCNKIYSFYKKVPDVMCKKWVVENLKNNFQKYYKQNRFSDDVLKQITKEEFDTPQYKGSKF